MTPPPLFWWHDLADSELRARLIQRGVNPIVAARMIRHRDDDYPARLITVALVRPSAEGRGVGGTVRTDPAPGDMKQSTKPPPLSETEFQTQVVQFATLLGWSHLHVRRSIGRGRKWVTATNVVGWPDLLLWSPSRRRVVAVELKAENGQVTPEQADVLTSLTASGVECHVWRPSDWPEVETVLR